MNVEIIIPIVELYRISSNDEAYSWYLDKNTTCFYRGYDDLYAHYVSIQDLGPDLYFKLVLESL